jgi:sporulation protein YabP
MLKGGKDMTDGRLSVKHTIVMENRNSVKITGVLDVVSFDMETIVAETEMGVIILKGDGLHVNRLNLQNGELDIDGEVSSLAYEENFARGHKGSFFGSLFK